MKKNIIDLKKLNKITVNLIREKNFSIDDRQITMISRNKESFWGLVSLKYYGYYNYNSSLLFYHWWIKNTNGFYFLVKSTLENINEKKQDNQDENQVKEIFVNLSFTEWSLFQKEITGKVRKKLKVKFTDFLSKKMQDIGINCWLKCNYNWFSTSQSKSTPFWVGSYKCLDEKCKQNLKACIIDPIKPNDFVRIQIKYRDFGLHNKISKIKRVSGEERKNLAVKLKACGISNIRNENVILNNLDKSFHYPTNKNTLAQIKYEFDHIDRLSNNIISDITATKLVCENLCLTKTEFKGFIHNISLDPYGFLMITDIQIKMWEIISKKHPVWYFDATGSVHKDIYQQKKPFLFSIVTHDIETKCIIPVAEFITTCHTSNNIAKFLSSIQNILENFMISTDFTVAPIIVTDFSWALINSVMNQFNSMTIQHYLNWCFQILFHYSENQQANYLVRSRIYLCSVHFLKNIIKKAKKVKIKENVITTFIFCFSLLQNSQNIDQFNKYLINIYNIFQNQLYDETVQLSLEFIRQEIKNRELECLDVSEYETAEQESKQKDSEYTAIYLGHESVETVIKSSPFNSYFLNILDQFNIELIKMQKLKIENDANYKFEPNEFFSRNLLEIILEQLYIMPLWSGVMLNQFKLFNSNKKFYFTTRLSNNPVENYFGKIKHNLIPKKKVYPSELVSPLYKRLKAKYFEFYLNELEDEKPKKNINQMMSNIQESWSDKNEKKLKIKKKKEKIDNWKKEKGFFL